MMKCFQRRVIIPLFAVGLAAMLLALPEGAWADEASGAAVIGGENATTTMSGLESEDAAAGEGDANAEAVTKNDTVPDAELANDVESGDAQSGASDSSVSDGGAQVGAETEPVPNPDPAFTPGFQTDGEHLVFIKDDGSLASNEWVTAGSAKYRFNSEGHALVGFQKVEGQFYWFDDNGKMKSGRADRGNGMFSLFEMNKDGFAPARTGWYKEGEKTYYLSPATGVSVRWGQKIDGAFYYFNGYGHMQTGWITWHADGTKSYFDANGKARVGWQNIDGNRYYFYLDTGKSARWSRTIDGAEYYFDGQSRMYKGLLTWSSDGLKSYYGNDGKLMTGWVKTGGFWYYIDPATGKSVRWERTIGGATYYFNGASQMHTGLLTWVKDGLKSYYDANGKKVTGWVKDSGKWYYIDPATGKSVRWERTIGGATYYFNGASQMHTGILTWQSDGLKSFYDANGKKVTGWQSDRYHWYYINPKTGKSLRWSQVIDGCRYYFNGESQMHTGWLKWNGQKLWSYYWSNGVGATGTHVIGGYSYTFDNNGYTTTEPITIPADQLAMNNRAQGFSSSTKYLILINSSTHKVGVYQGSKGSWKNIYYWDCTTGAKGTPTKKGSYTVGIKMKSFGSGYTCWYATQFSGNYLFHSVLYQPGSMSRIQDGRLGIAASHGCVRLSIGNAKWIYNNIPKGTKVYSY